MNNVDRALVLITVLLVGFFTFVYCMDSGPGNGLVIAGLWYVFSGFTLPAVLIGMLVSYLSSGNLKAGLLGGLLTGTTLTFLTIMHLLTLH